MNFKKYVLLSAALFVMASNIVYSANAESRIVNVTRPGEEATRLREIVRGNPNEGQNLAYTNHKTSPSNQAFVLSHEVRTCIHNLI